MSQKHRGFHLIEILLTLVIISIITLFALPQYTQHLVKQKRLEAATMLMKLALALEKYQLVHANYDDASLDNLKIPEYVAENSYQLAISQAEENDYLITATPLHEQASRDVQCGQLSLDSHGRKNMTGTSSVDACW